MDDDTFLALAASAELPSEHPLGKAMVTDYMQKHSNSIEQPEEFKLLASRGITL